jgi:C-terminal processing protease CtpA/Prc
MIDRTTLFQLAKALEGLPVLGTLPGTPAARAGIHYGDILVSVNGRRTRTFGDYILAKALRADGMTIVIFRSGQEQTEELVYNTNRNKADPAMILSDLISMRLLIGGEIEGKGPAS